MPYKSVPQIRIHQLLAFCVCFQTCYGQLTEHGRPDQPYDVQGVNVTYHSVDVIWTLGSDNGDTQQFGIIHYFGNSTSTYQMLAVNLTVAYNDTGSGQNASHHIDGLWSNETYRLAVTAQNKYGTSYSTQFVIRTSPYQTDKKPDYTRVYVAIFVSVSVVLSLIVFVIYLIRKKLKQRNADPNNNITITDDAKEAGIWRKQLREGSNYTITCIATLSTAARTYWTKDGHSGICQDGQRLVFIDIARSDSGTYTCHKGNDSSHTESQAVEQVYIDVTYPARITNFSVDPTSPMENDSVRIICNIEGNPAPVWELRNNWTHEVDFRGNRSQYLDLTIKTIGCDQSGPYMCTGYNELNHGTNTTRVQNVTVNCAPRPNPDAPGDYKVYAFPGMEVLFFDNVLGYPFPNYTWSRADGKPMGTVEEYSSPYLAALNISNIKNTDFGQYFLIMTNVYGSHRSVFNLIPYSSMSTTVSTLSTTVSHLSTTVSPQNSGPSNKFIAMVAGSAGGGAFVLMAVALVVAYKLRARRRAIVSSKTKLLN